MKETDRAKGSIRMLQGDHGYGLEIVGDVNSYVVTDAISAVVKANNEVQQNQLTAKRQDFLIRAATTVLSALLTIGLLGFLFGGGCSPKSSYEHPTQNYQGSY
ncbi:MAG: hypothetical protein AAGA46_03405 [Cyanobacteria bacterium P01_F01_bin.13]